MFVRLESCFGFCSNESLVNELDLQMGEQLAALRDKCNELALLTYLLHGAESFLRS